MHPVIDYALTPIDWLMSQWFPGNYFCNFSKGRLAGLSRRRKRFVASRVLSQLSKSATVNGGPFKGMRYGITQAKCSALLPKLLGTYESEIASILDGFLSTKQYITCLDIGVAEGYYAVGVARRQPNCQVHAFDTDLSALELCRSNARVNDCEEQITLHQGITAADLEKFPIASPGLIISDCEGYEKYLFTNRSVKNLVKCDLIIEIHDFYDSTISEHIQDVFLDTHQLGFVSTINDMQKALTYVVPQISCLDLELRGFLLSEFRPCPMRWAILTPKN
jgi:hypothetical protein